MYPKSEIAHYELGFTKAEFKRILETQERFKYQLNADSVLFKYADGAVTVKLGAESTRTIALMTAPKLDVTFNLNQLDPSHWKGFTQLFLKTFLKGGG